jgi:hypothetical protein
VARIAGTGARRSGRSRESRDVRIPPADVRQASAQHGRKEPEEVTTTIASTDRPDSIESTVTPLIKGVIITCPDQAMPGPDGTCPVKVVVVPKEARTQRNLAIAAIIGGGGIFLGGLGMWSSASGSQTKINNFPEPRDSNDFAQLKDLEDKASSRAWFGNLLVAGGLTLAGFGIYYYWKDRKAHVEGGRVQPPPATIAPTPLPGGAGITIRIIR